MNLENKIALVTGGAGGIGSAICKKLADEGASVVITYNSNKEKAENLLKILRGSNHAIFHAPTTDAEKVNALADFVKAKYGRLDILVNNAGITTPVPHANLEDLTDEWIDKIMQTNVRGTFAIHRLRNAVASRFNNPSKPASDFSSCAWPLARDLLSSLASSNSTASASGVLKSSSIASRKRTA